jgi:two-component system chemotaxis response regulator CheB
MAATGKKRVLIVDDAVVVRRVLSDAVAADPALEVAGTASNGRLALAKFPSLKPDIVLLDIEMPEMDGLETVRELRKIDAHVPIIMFSTLTEHGAAVTLEALAAGATDFVAKPSNADMERTKTAVSGDLMPKIRALCGLPEPFPTLPDTPPPLAALPAPLPPRAPARVVNRRPVLAAQIVAIGVSTGGPDALARVIPALPAGLPVPVVIVQHMPPIFTTMLAKRLSQNSPLPVRECKSGEELVPGCVFLAPGDFHMVIHTANGVARLKTNQGPKENFCRPSVDVLFRSVAETFGARTLAVVLTGMGHDGLSGSEILHQQGAQILVQDEATSVVWGMPGFVARAGLADKILPLDSIGPEVVRLTSGRLAARF